jgi:hypothetical protein
MAADDNEDDGIHLIHPLPVDLIALDVPNRGGYEAEDALKPEVVRWLIGNCLGRWFFRQFVGPEVTEIVEGEARTGKGVSFGLEFSDRRDFELFKQRWQGGGRKSGG